MTDLRKQLGFAGDMARMIASNNSEQQSLDNSSRDCAAEAIRQMLNEAKSEVCIYCHSLADDIYDRDEIVDSLNNAYKRNEKLDVMIFIRDEYPMYNRFLLTLINRGAKIARNMTFRLALSAEKEKGALIPDFFNVDDKYLRVEVSEQDRSANVYKNNNKILEKVKESVQILLRVASPVKTA